MDADKEVVHKESLCSIATVGQKFKNPDYTQPKFAVKKY